MKKNFDKSSDEPKKVISEREQFMFERIKNGGLKFTYVYNPKTKEFDEVCKDGTIIPK